MTENDEPTLIDKLGRGDMIREIGDAVADGKPPLVLGVHGDWGIGKTSALQQIQYHLSGDCAHSIDEDAEIDENKLWVRADADRFVTVWFEAWRYQNEPVPIVALLHEIRAQMGWWMTTKGFARQASSVAFKGAVQQIDSITEKIGIQGSKFIEQWNQHNREHLAEELPSRTIRDLFEKAIGEILGMGKKKRGSVDYTKSRRLVVLIDDLDRCEPEMAFRLLEGIKIYLGLSNCVFVLGMNQSVIEEAIAKNLSAEDKWLREIRAAAYLEKLCQNVWRLPSIRQPDKFLLGRLRSPYLRNRIFKATDGAFNWLPRNPRKLKGYANLLTRMLPRLRLKAVRDLYPDPELPTLMLLTVAYVYHFHHNLYVRWEASPGLWMDMVDWASGDTRLAKEPPFRAYELPYRNDSPGEDAPSDEVLSPRHPDPTQPNIFWVQPIVFDLGNGVAPEDFRLFMDGV